MGSWGTGIMQDDTVLDIIEEFKNYLKDYQNVTVATQKLIENNSEIIEDSDEGPLVWIALAKCQWEYGKLDVEIYNRVVQDFKKEIGMDLWKEESVKEYEKRKKVISEFISKIGQPNPKIKKMPRKVVRKPVFEAGDCLSLKLNDEYFGAALVVRYDDSSEEYGKNLIIALDYWERQEPVLKDFSEIRFLTLNFGNWNGETLDSWLSPLGFREYKSRVIKIGNIDISRYKDLSSRYYYRWDSFLHQIEREKSGNFK